MKDTTQMNQMTDINQLQETYATFVEQYSKSGEDIIQGLDPRSAHLLHMAIGLASEAGELLDAIKKHAIYGKPLDLGNVIEELGDVEFYVTGIINGCWLRRDDIIQANMEKLKKRYPRGKYTNESAIFRADKSTESSDY
jgi:NTP pyrophosphatase (non-canonical NTP hydrolase)